MERKKYTHEFKREAAPHDGLEVEAAEIVQGRVENAEVGCVEDVALEEVAEGADAGGEPVAPVDEHGSGSKD